MLLSLPALLLSTLVALSQVQAIAVPTPTVNHIREKDLTNAERMQRGMPLKAPERRYDPTRPHVFNARASEMPLQAVMRMQRLTRRGEEKRKYYQRYITYDSEEGVYRLTSEPEEAKIFTLPGSGPVTTGYQAATAGGYLALEGDGFTTVADTWVANLTTVADSDGGSPIGKMYQTSVWGIDGYGSSVKGTYTVDVGTNLDARFFFDTDCRIVTAVNPELPELFYEIFFDWVPIPEPIVPPPP